MARMRLVPGENDLTTMRPDLSQSILLIDPSSVWYKSTVEAIWCCPECGHTWRAGVRRRVERGSGCPKCRYRERGMKRRKGSWSNAWGPAVCSVSGCESNVQSRGWCSAHYTRFLRFGSPTGLTPKSICPVKGCGRAKNKDAVLCGRCRQFGWRYGLGDEQVLWFMDPENRKCSNRGCQNKTNLHLDHDHSCCGNDAFPSRTKVSCGQCVRGWLCRSCNLAEGYLGADEDRIIGLLEYLRFHKKTPSR